MCMTLVSKREARRLLRGHWRAALGVQVTVPLVEGLVLSTAWWMPGDRVAATVWALLADLLLVSPLKAGRAFFFETLAADGDAVRYPLLLRYCRHGYGRTVGWRLMMWCERLLWLGTFSPPALVLFVFSKRLASETLLSLTLFWLGLTLLTAAVIAAELLLFRRAIVPYFLSYPGGLRGARAAARDCLRGRHGTLLWLYLDYAFPMLFTPLILPWLYASTVFQTARAATVREFLRHFPRKRNQKPKLL